MFTLTDYALWFFAAVFDGLLFSVLLKKKYYQRFPWLTGLMAFKLTIRHALLCVLLLIDYTPYFWAYWVSRALLLIIYGFVIQELFLLDWHLLKVGGPIIASCAYTVSHFMPSREMFFMPILRNIELGLWVCVVGLLVWSRLDRPAFMLKLEYRMAYGLIILAVWGLVKTILSALLGYKSAVLLSTVGNGVYLLAVSLWIYALKVPLEAWFVQSVTSLAAGESGGGGRLGGTSS